MIQFYTPEWYTYIFVYVMLVISLVPIIAISRSNDPAARIAFAASFSTKLACLIIAAGIFRQDWMIGCIGAFILVVGDAGMLLLSLLEMKIRS